MTDNHILYIDKALWVEVKCKFSSRGGTICQGDITLGNTALSGHVESWRHVTWGHDVLLIASEGHVMIIAQRLLFLWFFKVQYIS